MGCARPNLKCVKRAIIACVVGFFAGFPAHANLSANPIILEFQDGLGVRKDITISNTSDRTSYIQVSAARITNLGDGKEEYLTSPNPREVGLLVAPRRVILKPNEQKIIRVIALERAVKEDKAWRVNITPVAGDIKSKSNVVVTQLGYRVLVYARPENAFGDVRVERYGKLLTLTNTGNTNVLLEGQEQCASDTDECRNLPLKRLWPGQSRNIELPFDTPAPFKLRGPTGTTEVTF